MNNLYIKTCNEISSCVGTDWFNSCSECESGFVYKYKLSSDQIMFTECIQFSKTPNCFVAVPEDGGNQSYCKYCKKGFVKNEDGYCESYKPPRCLNSDSFTLSELAVNKN